MGCFVLEDCFHRTVIFKSIPVQKNYRLKYAQVQSLWIGGHYWTANETNMYVKSCSFLSVSFGSCWHMLAGGLSNPNQSKELAFLSHLLALEPNQLVAFFPFFFPWHVFYSSNNQFKRPGALDNCVVDRQSYVCHCFVAELLIFTCTVWKWAFLYQRNMGMGYILVLHIVRNMGHPFTRGTLSGTWAKLE